MLSKLFAGVEESPVHSITYHSNCMFLALTVVTTVAGKFGNLQTTTTPYAVKKQKTKVQQPSFAPPVQAEDTHTEYAPKNNTHQGEHLRQYSIHTRQTLDDYFHGLAMHEVLETNYLKIGNSGRGVGNTHLENLLLKFMANLDKVHLQFLSLLLIMEALDHYSNWLNGPSSPRFMDTAHAFEV